MRYTYSSIVRKQLLCVPVVAHQQLADTLPEAADISQVRRLSKLMAADSTADGRRFRVKFV